MFLFLGFIAAAQAANLLAASGLPETPAFIDDNFRPVLNGAAGAVNRTLVQPDGKILVAGNFHQIGGAGKNYIARFNADGSLDATFNTKSGANGQISALGLQSDGKIIVGGNFSAYGGQTVGNIARLNQDGSFDVTFNSAGVYYMTGANGTISDLSVTPDNRIYIVGGFTNYSGTAVNRLARLNPNGNLDETFAVGTGANSTVSVIEQYTGGKILIGGSFTNYGGTAINRLARINLDGSLDTSFNIGTGPSGGINSIFILPDDKILVGGSIATFNAVAKNGLARLNADGSDDATFAVSGTGAIIRAIARQSDGRLIVGGIFTAIAGTTRQSIARLGADGAFDATFNAGTGLNTTGIPVGTVNDLALQADGSVVLVGAFTSYNGTSRSGIARAASNGTLDAALAPTSSLAGNIYAIAKQPDGKVLIGGQFSAVGGAARTNVARLNANGSLDTTFNPGTGANGLVESLAVQADGKILVGGEFTQYNGTAIKGIARLGADGTLDTSFAVGTGVEGGVLTIALQTDGKVLIGGFITTYNSVLVNNIARLNADGSHDTTLATGTGVNSTVRKIVVQPDGKILVGGDFSTYNGGAKTRLMRINADGSADASFNPGTIAGGVNDFVLHADGKIAIVGAFTTINGTTRNRLARLGADGSLDTSFDPGAGLAGGNANAIAPTADGKYLVGGQFTTGGGLPKNRLVRVRANGSLDHKFLSGLGPIGSGSPNIRTIVPSDGKFLIGGQFETYNTSPRTGLVFMSSASKVPTDYDGDGKTDISILRHYGGIGPWTYWIQYSSTGDVSTFDFGTFGVDQVVAGDYDGDGRTDIAIWRARSGADNPNAYWINFSSTGQVKMIPYGLDGDSAQVEDYDGDGKDDLAIWRCPETTIGQATFIYRGSYNNPNGNLTYIPFGMRYGTQGDQKDKFIPGDFDGDGRGDFRVQRRVDLTVTTLQTPGIFYTLNSSNGSLTWEYFGYAGDRYLPGDYDGDGRTDIAIVRGHNITPGTTNWFIRYTSGKADEFFPFGAGGLDQFGPGDYDGDSMTDVTVYRRAMENNYYIRRSSDQQVMVMHWGNGDGLGGPASDIPVAWYQSR